MAEPGDRKPWRMPRERSRPAGAFGHAPKSERTLARAEIAKVRHEPWYREILDETRCFYCIALTAPRSRTRDHIVALSRGGLTSAENLVMACFLCNQTKSAKGLLAMLGLRVPEHERPGVIARLCEHAGIDEENLRFLTR